MKTPTQRAIELSIEGGWTFREGYDVKQLGLHVKVYYNDPEDTKITIDEYRMLLDPDFFKCLGKALGWVVLKPSEMTDEDYPEEYRNEHHRFIDLLHEGKTIDEALESIIGKE